MAKYALIFGGDAESNRAWENFSEEQRAQGMQMVGQWMGAHADKLVITHQLEDSAKAMRVRFTDGVPAVTDGPFIEAKETIGGFAIFEVADEAEAVELAKTWPAQGIVDVRLVVR